MMIKKPFVHLLIASVIVISCNNGPKVISGAETGNSEKSSEIFSEENPTNPLITENTSLNQDLHTVVVNEVLPATKYVYLRVNEAGEEFWIATGKQNINKGETYFYRGGLLKTNFESKEYDRMFDKIYLVTNLVPENHGNNSGTLPISSPSNDQDIVNKEDIPTHTEEIVQHKGSVKISEIVADPKKYEGKTVQITGKCVKVNPGIMERNWIHLQDGSKNDFDLVITSSSFVGEGQIVTMTAQVSLNRDFGGGYRYDLILENGIVIK